MTDQPWTAGYAFSLGIETEPGAYGIKAVSPLTPGAMICGSCGRAWLEDITPAGRCPWEDKHAHSDGEDEPWDDERILAMHEEARQYAREKAGQGIYDIIDAIADAYFDGATR